MGLDQYALTMRKRPETDVDFECDASELAELFYWRKHPNLHGWMRSLYIAKGGKHLGEHEWSDDFNAVPVVLIREDLIALEEAVEENVLPFTEGFFFGISLPEHKHQDHEFIAKARAVINDGHTVIYFGDY